MSKRSRHLLFWPIVVAGFTTDLVSKELAFALIGDATRGPGSGGVVDVIPGVFHLATRCNPGALWGMGAAYSHVLLGLTILAVIAIVVWVCCYLKDEERWLAVALGLIEAGALGNVVDRLRFGKVRDFLDVVWIHWPTFNLADAWLVVGAAIILLLAFTPRPNAGPPADP